MQNRTSQMTLNAPFIITPRLLTGLKIGNGFLSITYARTSSDGRTCYRYYIDVEGNEYSGSDLRSGCQGGDLQEGMASLLSFLSAAGEGYRYEMSGGKSENTDLFPQWVNEWAYQHNDELSLLSLEIEESEATLIQE